jgi:hypothetical protein
MNITFGNVRAGAGAGVLAASRYGSGSSSKNMMRLLAAPATAWQHCPQEILLKYAKKELNLTNYTGTG